MFSRTLFSLLWLCLICAPVTADDLSQFNDEFNDASTLKNWQRIHRDHKAPDQLETFDINQTQAGKLVMIPYTSVWYKQYRGVLTYKKITGDFVITTSLKTSNRAKNGPPRQSFSLAGIMLRKPSGVNIPNNYIFLSLGAATRPGSYQFEVKTTVNNRSQLNVANSPADHAIIQVARIGSNIITLKQTNGQWTVHRRYTRADFPKTLQAGLTCYTDWNHCKQLSPAVHNKTVVKNGQPDLYAEFDFVRYARPVVPAPLQSTNLTDPSQVSDTQLLSFLGKHAM